jgi:hypothetical protein
MRQGRPVDAAHAAVQALSARLEADKASMWGLPRDLVDVLARSVTRDNAKMGPG